MSFIDAETTFSNESASDPYSEIGIPSLIKIHISVADAWHWHEIQASSLSKSDTTRYLDYNRSMELEPQELVYREEMHSKVDVFLKSTV